MAKDLLIEIGTEELPPKALRNLATAFCSGIESGLKAHDLVFTAIKPYASPRRLAVIVDNLDEQTPEKEVVIWGPPAKIAFDDAGNPSKAAEAFARKNNIAVSELKTENDGKVDKLVHRANSGGVATSTLLAAIIEASLAALPIPKRMRWGASRNEFVRPVHWLVMLFGDATVDAEVMGLKAGRQTRGHRFHYNHTLELDSPADYVEKLRKPAYVLVNMDERRELIRQQVNAEADKLGGRAVIEDDLLEEVTALVEWPVALTGRFEERFLDVPAEALVYSMSEHQKYFHVLDADGKLLPNFITVANIESQDPAQVIDGNERVIRPRLSDAAFFFETDKKKSLASQRERLKSIVFQAKLGTLFEKTERVAALAGAIAEQLGADVNMARRAAELSKSDLVTDMVGEFDKMQGVAGYYYALNDGEPKPVAEALHEQYLPKFAGDKLPATETGTILAIADRLDTLVGIFGIGQQPSGSKDPFALRRASVSVLRLLVEKQLNLDLRQLLELAQAQYNPLPAAEGLVEQVLGYMIERFRAWYEEARIPVEVFQAVSAKNLSTPLDIDNRVHAVHRFSQLPEAQALAAANKRVSNILAKQGDINTSLDQTLLKENAEQALAEQVAAQSDKVGPLFADGRYTEALESLANLRGPVDSFFDSVMVMTDDEALRNNRLALLSQLHGLFLEVADISLLVPAKS